MSRLDNVTSVKCVYMRMRTASEFSSDYDAQLADISGRQSSKPYYRTVLATTLSEVLDRQRQHESTEETSGLRAEY